MGTWLVNGRLVGERNELSVVHILMEAGRIADVIIATEAETPDAATSFSGHSVIDLAGKLVAPGFIDMHVHFREPGFEHKETIHTGSLAAARGGYTTVACMPNTRPVIDTVDTVELVKQKAEESGMVRVLPYGCITKGELGKELTDFSALKQSGVVAFTDDGVGVQSAQMMKDAMILAVSLDMPIVAHCEDDTMIAGAPVTDGEFARKHGLKGLSNESEAIHVGRDILLAEATGAHYHVCHVSTEQSVRLIRQAKQLGIHVTTEVCPHHLLLSDEDIPGLDANWKMNPPLRSPRDVQAVLQGLEDGTIDMIVTDHAPHSEEEKARGMLLAPFGIVGLETAFPLLYTKFVLSGRWSLRFLLDKMTVAPADVFRLPWGRIEVGREADLTVIDLDTEREIQPEQFLSKSRNTPFAGWTCKGWPVLTFVGGKEVWREQSLNTAKE
jgi:dihydroorotase